MKKSFALCLLSKVLFHVAQSKKILVSDIKDQIIDFPVIEKDKFLNPSTFVEGMRVAPSTSPTSSPSIPSTISPTTTPTVPPSNSPVVTQRPTLSPSTSEITPSDAPSSFPSNLRSRSYWSYNMESKYGPKYWELAGYGDSIIQEYFGSLPNRCEPSDGQSPIVLQPNTVCTDDHQPMTHVSNEVTFFPSFFRNVNLLRIEQKAWFFLNIYKLSEDIIIFPSQNLKFYRILFVLNSLPM